MNHGRGTTYRKAGCRCDPCKAASAADMRDYRKRRYLARGATVVNPTGSVRRLEALAVMGWGVEAIAERAGMQPSAVARVRAGKHDPLLSTASRIARIYDELSMTRGPSPKARTWALRRGWLPPLAWDDDTIDDPAAWANPGEDADGEPDLIVVERLLSGAADWTQATFEERCEAGRHALRRENGWKFCQDVLRLNGRIIRSLRDEVAA